MSIKRRWQDAKPRAKYAVHIKSNDNKNRYEFIVYNREGKKVHKVYETYYVNGIINIEDSYWNGIKKLDEWLGDYHNYEVYWYNPYWEMCKNIKI